MPSTAMRKQKSWLARALAVSGPKHSAAGSQSHVSLELELLWLEVDEKADTRPLHEAIESIEHPGDKSCCCEG